MSESYGEMNIRHRYIMDKLEGAGATEREISALRAEHAREKVEAAYGDKDFAADLFADALHQAGSEGDYTLVFEKAGINKEEMQSNPILRNGFNGAFLNCGVDLRVRDGLLVADDKTDSFSLADVKKDVGGMKDKNGAPLRVGDIVRIEHAYFKTDNGLYVVVHAPKGDPRWTSGKDFCLAKINKDGTLRSGKGSTGFWPIMVTVNGWEKTTAAKEWNKENATIEVVHVVDTTHVTEYFMQQAAMAKKDAEYELLRNDGAETAAYRIYQDSEAFCRSVADRLESEKNERTAPNSHECR